jgi:hypothetical protein
MAIRIVTGAAVVRAGVTLALVAGGVAGVQSVFAQRADSVRVDVGDCAKLQSPDERLACYDRRVEAARQPARADASSPSAAAPVSAPNPSQPGSARAAESAPAAASPRPLEARAASISPAPSSGPLDRRALRRSADEPPAADSRELVATVTELRQTVPNSWLITFDNGEVWKQNFPERYALRTGQRVTLRPTKWGSSYRLSVEELGGFIQVERVR